MKTLTTLLILSFSIYSENIAQTVNGIPLDSLNAEYIQIVVCGVLNRKVQLDIDYGQEDIAFTPWDFRVRDNDGKRLTLNSMVDALNFLSSYGYELVEIGGINTDRYILRKKNESITEDYRQVNN